MDPLLETDNANNSDFQSKIAQQTTDIVLDRKSLFLEYLSSGEERPSFLACKRLDVHARAGARFLEFLRAEASRSHRERPGRALGRSGGDPFVIALARIKCPPMTVVTEESPGKQSAKPSITARRKLSC